MENAGRPDRWSGPVRIFHWGMAALIAALLILGFVMTTAPLDLATSFELYQWHKWVGLMVLVLWLPRLLARAAARAPARLRGWQGRVAGMTHGALYGLLLAMPVTGWLTTSASPLHLPLVIPLPFIGLVTLPDLMAPNAQAYGLLSGLHEILAYGLCVLVALHVAAAIKHAVIDHDGTLRRMVR